MAPPAGAVSMKLQKLTSLSIIIVCKRVTHYYNLTHRLHSVITMADSELKLPVDQYLDLDSFSWVSQACVACKLI